MYRIVRGRTGVRHTGLAKAATKAKPTLFLVWRPSSIRVYGPLRDMRAEPMCPGGAAAMSADELDVYRAPFACLAPAWVGAGVLFIVGLSMVTIGPSQRGAIGSVAVGALGLLFSVWLGAVLATNRLVVARAGLVHCKNLRRRVISWSEVESFRVSGSGTPMRWPAVVICRNDGSVLVTSVVSFTMTFPSRVADELAWWQRRLVPATLGQTP